MVGSTLKRLEIAGTGAHGRIEARHGFQIVVEDIGLGFHHCLDRAFLAKKVRCQYLDRGVRCGFTQAANAFHELRCAAVIKIVTINGRNDNVFQLQFRHGGSEVLRLHRIDDIGLAGLDVAEGTGAGAGIAQDHHRGMTLGPAFSDIGACRFFAHGIELKPAHQLARRVVFR
jgi:hypothetical protein